MPGPLMPIIAGASLLYGAASGASQRRKEERREGEMARLISGEVPRIEEAIGAAGDVYGMQIGLLETQRRNEMEQVGWQTGTSLFDLMQQAGAVRGKAGFAGFGAVEREQQRGMGDILTGAEFKQQSIYDVFAGRELEAQLERDRQVSELEQRRRDIEVQLAGMGYGAKTVFGMDPSKIKGVMEQGGGGGKATYSQPTPNPYATLSPFGRQ